jgi:hypothetical protein
VVSARKEARSAHVEISKMEVKDEGGQERTAPKPRRPPIMPRGEHVRVGLFLYTCKHVPGLFRLSLQSPPSPRLRLPLPHSLAA